MSPGHNGPVPTPPRDLSRLRREYGVGRLLEEDVAADPFAQFDRWLVDAAATGVPEVNAMTVATADESGVVTARTVLLKGVDSRGFVFATNYRSRKGRDIAANPHAALTFYWREMERQVCVVGRAARTTRAESDLIFAARPRAAQLAAHASAQSSTVPDRGALEQRVAELDRTFADVGVPRPAHWGGVRVVPDIVEFWQGGPARLHDRLRYRRTGRGWVVERLAP